MARLTKGDVGWAAGGSLGGIAPSSEMGGADPPDWPALPFYHGARLFRAVEDLRNAPVDGGDPSGQCNPAPVGTVRLCDFLSGLRLVSGDDVPGDPLAPGNVDLCGRVRRH